MSRPRLAFILAAAILALLVAPADALAAGNDVGRNIGQLLRHYASRSTAASSRSSAWSSC